jgi:ABC-type uncharacterized transport system permease subunit
MRRLILVAFALGSCGEVPDSQKADAAMQSDAMVDAPSGTALTCMAYCTSIAAYCSGIRAQYGSMANCMDSCGTLMVGTAGVMAGNTLACRVAHVDLAKNDPAAHCEHAGPSGGGTCGNLC